MMLFRLLWNSLIPLPDNQLNIPLTDKNKMHRLLVQSEIFSDQYPAADAFVIYRIKTLSKAVIHSVNNPLFF